MNKKSLKILFLTLLFGGCSIIFEDDLSGDTILVNMPINGTVSQDSVQLFWWENLEGALGYRLQIVAGSFDEPFYLVVDTNASNNKFHFELFPGDYQWRIKGWNNYSETDYVYNDLTILDQPANEK